MRSKILNMQLFAVSILLLAFAPCSFEAAELAAGGDLASETSESADEGTNEVQSEDAAQESASGGESSEQADGGGDGGDDNSHPADGDPV